MRNLLLASAAVFTLNAFAPAMAADIAAARPSYVKTPAPAVAVYNWTGFYLGAYGGYASEKSSEDSKIKGGLAGGTAGYNWQTGSIVLGVEADGGWADVSASQSGLGVTAKGKVSSLGTVRGRLGFAVDQVLFYGTGGYAWGESTLSLSTPRASFSDSHFHSGWTAGAGIEAFFAPQWSVKGEYLYRRLSSETYVVGPFRSDASIELHSFQLGVNYHFGGPVVAKY